VLAAGQDAVLDLAEPREVGREVRAPALHEPVAEAPHLGDLALLGQPVLDVARLLRRERLEPRVDVLVVRALAGRAEAAGQEERVDPVVEALPHAGTDQRVVDDEGVAVVAAVVRDDPAVREVEHDPLGAEVEQDAVTQARAQVLGGVHQRLEPRGERGCSGSGVGPGCAHASFSAAIRSFHRAA
jgi:hypothetical protein